MPRFSAPTREKIAVGSRVIGKSRAIDGQIGTVQAIEGDGPNKKFCIRWRNLDNHAEGVASHYPKRSFQLYSQQTPRERCNGPPAANPVRAAAGHSAAASSDSSDLVSGSSELDDAADSSSDYNAAAAPRPNIIQLQRWDSGHTMTLGTKDGDSLTWTVRESIPGDLHDRVHSEPTAFNWNVIGMDAFCDKTVYDYWRLAFPGEALRQEVLLTNMNIDAANAAAAANGSIMPPVARASTGEIIRKHGLRVAMALIDAEKPTSWFWTASSTSDTVITPPAFGNRFHISRERFMQLEQHEQFNPRPADAADDPWWHVRQLVSLFNARRAAIMKCGRFICEDHSGSWTPGNGSRKLPDGVGVSECSHVTYANKKTEGHLMQFNSLCDVLTGVMIALEIEEGPARARSKAFCDVYPPHVALSLRLLQAAGLLQSWRVIIADADFGSVSACKALLRHGMLSMMIVKHHHAMFPLKAFTDWSKVIRSNPDSERKGSSLVYSATVKIGDQDHRIAAVAHMQEKARAIITSYGSTAAGRFLLESHTSLVTDEQGNHSADTEQRQIQCPNNVADMIAGFGAIDEHNALLKGFLESEYKKKAGRWWKGAAATVHSMIVADAYKIFCYDRQRSAEQPLSFRDFRDRLAHELIFNEHTQAAPSLARVPAALNSDEHVLASVTALGRLWTTVVDGELKTNDARGCCRVCKQKTAYWCKKCSVVADGKAARRDIVYLCSPAKRPCFYRHVKDNNGNDEPQ